MRIVLATPLYPPEPGGPATYAKLVEDELPKRGIAIEVVKFRDVRHLPPLIRHIAYGMRLYRATKGADLLFVQDTVSCGLPALLVASLRHIPLVVRVPGDYVWEQSVQRFGVTSGIDAFQKEKGPWQSVLLRSIQNRVVRSARTVIVPSEYFAKLVAGWGVPASKIVVVYHGISLPEALPHIVRPAGRLVVSSGRLVPWKGFRELIECIARMPEWTLAIIGDGPDRSALESVAHSLGVTDRVIFVGKLPRSEALAWCKAADAFVLNTAFESFSFQVAEAMALGTPVVATNAGSLPEVLHSPEEGILVAPGDLVAIQEALGTVVTQPEEWKRRTQAAVEKARTFSVERMLSATVTALSRNV